MKIANPYLDWLMNIHIDCVVLLFLYDLIPHLTILVTITTEEYKHINISGIIISIASVVSFKVSGYFNIPI